MVAEDHLESITECPDCASQNIVHSTMRDQIICRDCGLVFEPLAPTKPAPAPKAAKTPVKKAAAKARKPPKKAVRKAKPKKAKSAKKSKPGKKRRFGWW